MYIFSYDNYFVKFLLFLDKHNLLEILNNKLGRITVSGEITEYEIPTVNARPHAITKQG